MAYCIMHLHAAAAAS